MFFSVFDFSDSIEPLSLEVLNKIVIFYSCNKQNWTLNKKTLENFKISEEFCFNSFCVMTGHALDLKTVSGPVLASIYPCQTGWRVLINEKTWKMVWRNYGKVGWPWHPPAPDTKFSGIIDNNVSRGREKIDITQIGRLGYKSLQLFIMLASGSEGWRGTGWSESRRVERSLMAQYIG